MSNWRIRPERRDISTFEHELKALLPRLRGFARSYCGNASDADDMVQITCEMALSRWTQWRGEGSFENWLKKILINAWRSEHRSRKLRAVGSDDKIIDESGYETAPDSAVFLDQVQLEIMRLPDGQREVLLLVAGEGMSYREVSELLEIPIGTVMSRLSRARKTLIDLFGEARND